jgi:hypothetical protein
LAGKELNRDVPKFPGLQKMDLKRAGGLAGRVKKAK